MRDRLPIQSILAGYAVASGTEAVEWAADLALRHRARLRVLGTYSYGRWISTGVAAELAVLRSEVAAAAHGEARRLVASLPQELSVCHSMESGSLRGALRRALSSECFDLVVVPASARWREPLVAWRGWIPRQGGRALLNPPDLPVLVCGTRRAQPGGHRWVDE